MSNPYAAQHRCIDLLQATDHAALGDLPPEQAVRWLVEALEAVLKNHTLAAEYLEHQRGRSGDGGGGVNHDPLCPAAHGGTFCACDVVAGAGLGLIARVRADERERLLGDGE